MIVGLKMEWLNNETLATGNFIVLDGVYLSILKEGVDFQTSWNMYRSKEQFDKGEKPFDRKSFAGNPDVLTGQSLTLDWDSNEQWAYQNASVLFTELGGAVIVEDNS